MVAMPSTIKPMGDDWGRGRERHSPGPSRLPDDVADRQGQRIANPLTRVRLSPSSPGLDSATAL
jgi:hypothetical protein